MLTIKDFTKGQSAYEVGRKHLAADTFIREVSVTCVGTKYVTVDSNGERTKYEGINKPYLQEVSLYSSSLRLFPNLQAANEQIEKEELIRWLSCINWLTLEKCTLEQLREIKQILTVE